MKFQLPKHIQFTDLKPGEEMRLFLRRHPIVIWHRVSFLLLAGLLPLAGWVFLTTQTSWIADGGSVVRVVVGLGFSLFYLFWARLIFTIWLDYYLDVWIVTTERILNINQEGLFHREVSQQRLSRVQDVKTETRGWLQTMLHYGDIRVQTAAENENFVFEDIQHPEDVAQIISELHSQALRREFAGSEEARMRPGAGQNTTSESGLPSEREMSTPQKQ